MVLVGEARVAVLCRFMPMAARVPRRHGFAGLVLRMMDVVTLLVLMFQRVVRATVGVPFAQVWPHAQRHQCAGGDERRRQALAEQ